jgi:haloalkane dehalogenase
VRDEGDGPVVLCLHGMIGTSFLYRKMLAELATRGLRGVAFDLPGFGLAQRPADYDYSWTGLGQFCVAAVGELGLDRFHLVVHDIGGPVGFELALAAPERVASLTLLNTTIDVTDFRSPRTMEPFRHAGVGEAWMSTLNGPVFRWGADDPTMTLAVYGQKARAAAGLADVTALPGKHFPQEDQAPAIAAKIAELAR